MFVESPLPDDQVEKVNPRAYVSKTYEKDKVPYPKKFVETIENSFEDADEKLHFVKKYYQLLCHREFPKKKQRSCVLWGKQIVKRHHYLLLFKVSKIIQ